MSMGSPLDRESRAPHRRVDAGGVLALSRMARLSLSPEHAAAQAERLESFLAFAGEWDDLGLAFTFEDGTFDYAPSLAQFRPGWDLPTKLNKGRMSGSTDPGSGRRTRE